MSDFQQFETINNDVKTNNMTPQEGENALKAIDFTKFSAQEMEIFCDADWISDDTAVKIMKSWKQESDKVLLELRGNTLFHSTYDSNQLQAFIDATMNPSKKPDLLIENIFHNMATAAGTRPFVNPISGHLITCSNHNNNLKDDIKNLFDEDNNTTFSGNPSRDEFLLIQFPPFLRVKLIAYTLSAAPKTAGGIKHWIIYGSNDNTTFIPLHQCIDDNHLLPGSTHKFVIPEPVDMFFNYFKIVTESNHANNLSFVASTLDFDGIVTIHPYKVLE